MCQPHYELNHIWSWLYSPQSGAIHQSTRSLDPIATLEFHNSHSSLAAIMNPCSLLEPMCASYLTLVCNQITTSHQELVSYMSYYSYLSIPHNEIYYPHSWWCTWTLPRVWTLSFRWSLPSIVPCSHILPRSVLSKVHHVFPSQSSP